MTPKLERHSAQIAILRIASDDDPHLTTAMVPGFRKAAEAIAADREIRAVLVVGGHKHFSAGARVDELAASDPEQQVTSYVAEVPRAILAIPVPTIAVMEGHAIGGGLVLGLWCDMAVLAEESLYGTNFMALGFTPGMGATAVVPDAFGGPLGREMLITGRMLKGREIADARIPLSGSVVPRIAVYARALGTAESLVETPRGALELIEVRLKQVRQRALEEALTAETAMHAELFANPATRARITERYVTAR
jgi:enoyl-CoA hydratase/carnithine racemase